MDKMKPCYNCKTDRHVSVDPDALHSGVYCISCSNCADVDYTNHAFSTSGSWEDRKKAAIAQWNDAQDEAAHEQRKVV